MRIIIRRPHAYAFKRRFPGAAIPGVSILDAAGKHLETLALPSKNGARDLLDLMARHSGKRLRP